MSCQLPFWADDTDRSLREKAVQTFGYGELGNPEVIFFEQLTRLREEVTRLRCIQQSEREMDVWYCALAQADRQPHLGVQPGDLRPC